MINHIKSFCIIKNNKILYASKALSQIFRGELDKLVLDRYNNKFIFKDFIISFIEQKNFKTEGLEFLEIKLVDVNYKVFQYLAKDLDVFLNFFCGKVNNDLNKLNYAKILLKDSLDKIKSDLNKKIEIMEKIIHKIKIFYNKIEHDMVILKSSECLSEYILVLRSLDYDILNLINLTKPENILKKHKVNQNLFLSEINALGGFISDITKSFQLSYKRGMDDLEKSCNVKNLLVDKSKVKEQFHCYKDKLQKESGIVVCNQKNQIIYANESLSSVLEISLENNSLDFLLYKMKDYDYKLNDYHLGEFRIYEFMLNCENCYSFEEILNYLEHEKNVYFKALVDKIFISNELLLKLNNELKCHESVLFETYKDLILHIQDLNSVAFKSRQQNIDLNKVQEQLKEFCVQSKKSWMGLQSVDKSFNLLKKSFSKFEHCLVKTQKTLGSTVQLYGENKILQPSKERLHKKERITEVFDTVYNVHESVFSKRNINVYFKNNFSFEEAVLFDIKLFDAFLHNLFQYFVEASKNSFFSILIKTEKANHTLAHGHIEVVGNYVILERLRRLLKNRRGPYTGEVCTILQEVIKKMNMKMNFWEKESKGILLFKAPVMLVKSLNSKIKSSKEKVDKRKTLKEMRLRTLIVDDIEVNRKILGRLFGKNVVVNDFVLKSFLREAKNGLEAVELFYQNNFNLILMDIDMPVMNGRDAVSAIRAFNCEVYLLNDFHTSFMPKEILVSIYNGMDVLVLTENHLYCYENSSVTPKVINLNYDDSLFSKINLDCLRNISHEARNLAIYNYEKQKLRRFAMKYGGLSFDKNKKYNTDIIFVSGSVISSVDKKKFYDFENISFCNKPLDKQGLYNMVLSQKLIGLRKESISERPNTFLSQGLLPNQVSNTHNDYNSSNFKTIKAQERLLGLSSLKNKK